MLLLSFLLLSIISVIIKKEYIRIFLIISNNNSYDTERSLRFENIYETICCHEILLLQEL